MLLWKYMLCKILFIVFYGLCGRLALADVITLEEEAIYGKQEQPGIITFISMAPLKENVVIPSYKVSEKIIESVHDEIFSVRGMY